MELATQPLSDKTNTVIIVPVMDNSIKFMPLVKPLDSRLRPELVGVWNSVSGTPPDSATFNAELGVLELLSRVESSVTLSSIV